MSDDHRYLEVLENLHTGVVIHAADTRIVFCNRRAAALLGLSEAQMMGKTAIDPGWHFVDSDGRRLAPEQYPVTQVLATQTPLDDTVVGVIAPGRRSVMWLLVTAFPEFEDDRSIRRVVVNFHDVCALKQTQETLRASEYTYRTLFETVPQGIVYQDTQGHITQANPAALRILGLTMDQMLGRTSMDPTWKSIHEDGSTFPGEQHPAMQALRTGQLVHGVVMGITSAGRGPIWISTNATPLFRDGVVSEVYAIFEDITERKNLELQVKQLAFVDPLTGLPNRRLLEDRMAQALAASKRSGCQGALMVLDLDNFKPLNDSHGHAVGDLLLVEVAHRLTHGLREIDTVARLGGDEFVVIVRELVADGAGAEQQALAIAEKVRAALAEPYTLTPVSGCDRTPVTHACAASVGVALFDAASTDAAQVLGRADAAMYQAKHAGRNQVRLSQG